jgi:hypothetical protein
MQPTVDVGGSDNEPPTASSPGPADLSVTPPQDLSLIRPDARQQPGRRDPNTARLALQLGFVAVVITAAVVLVAVGLPAAAVLTIIGGAGLAAVEILRRLR